MTGINVQVNAAVVQWLGTIRDQLTAAPGGRAPQKQAGSASSARSAALTLSAKSNKPAALTVPPSPARPADPVLRRLDDLIKALAWAAAVKERVDTVEELASRMLRSRTIALELETEHKFSSIKLADGKDTIEFSRIRECIQLAHHYYDRLAYYKTDEGRKFLKGVVSAMKPDLNAEGDVAVRDHHFDEHVDPLAAVRSWKYQEHYLPWAAQQYQAESDPIEHIDEFLIGVNGGSIGDGVIRKFLMRWAEPTQARLHPTRPVGDWLNVEVRTYVRGDERFSERGPPRMWSLQVKVPAREQAKPDKIEHGKWEWTCEVWSKNAISLPVLRVVHTEPGGPARQGINNDFTRGTLYAMRGPSEMRCYPALKFHSALYDGEVTSAAGILVADDGRVVAIDNRSGHYQPGYRQLQTAVQFLLSRQLFERDAFVSVHVTNQDKDGKTDADALYFSPADFLVAAQSGMHFPIVARYVAKTVRDCGPTLPVARRHAGLLPAVLRDFPIHNGRNRWDRALASYYAGDGGLETIVADFKAALKLATTPPPGNKSATIERKVVDQASLAPQILKKIESGGAYCHLPQLLSQLVTPTQAIGGERQNSPIQAKYRDIEKRLTALKPNLQKAF